MIYEPGLAVQRVGVEDHEACHHMSFSTPIGLGLQYYAHKEEARRARLERQRLMEGVHAAEST